MLYLGFTDDGRKYFVTFKGNALQGVHSIEIYRSSEKERLANRIECPVYGCKPWPKEFWNGCRTKARRRVIHPP